MSGSPAAARKVGSQSWWWMISFETTPAGILPGQRTTSGTRNAPSQFVFFSLRNGVMPRVWPAVLMRAVVGRVHDDRVVCDPELVQHVQQLRPRLLSWSIIVSWYGDCQRPAWPRLSGLVCVRNSACASCSSRRRTASPPSAWRRMKSMPAPVVSSSMVSMRFLVSGPVSSIRCLPSGPSEAPRSRRSSSSLAQRVQHAREARTGPGSSGNSSSAG